MSREFWLAIRQALLMVVDALERELGLPRTAELRKEKRQPEATPEELIRRMARNEGRQPERSAR